MQNNYHPLLTGTDQELTNQMALNAINPIQQQVRDKIDGDCERCNLLTCSVSPAHVLFRDRYNFFARYFFAQGSALE